MNNRITYLLLLVMVSLSQCKVYQDVVSPDAVALSGIAGLEETCIALDTIQSVRISKANALISTEEERYETEVTIYAVKDSFIYMSAANSGFEILRAYVDRDSIMVIDRLNKFVYRTPMKRRFGYSHPVDFSDLQHLISRYFICDNLERASETGQSHIEFDFDESHIRKRMSLDRLTFKLMMFEFLHTKTHKYIMGESTPEGFKIVSNFMISEFEILANQGEVSYNQDVEIKMRVNPRRYSVVNL